MSNTTNYNLVKPATTEFYDVAVQNGNMDIIDAAMKGLSDGQTAAQILTKIKTVDGINSGLDSDLWRGWKLYSSVAELGLDELTCTPQQVADAMPAKSRLKAYILSGNPNFIDGTAIVVTAEKTPSVGTEFGIVGIYTNGEHIVKTARYFNNGAVTTQWTGWKDVILNDKKVTTITTGFDPNWYGAIRANKNHNNLLMLTVNLGKLSDISPTYEALYTLAPEFRPLETVSIAVTLIDNGGIPIVGCTSFLYIQANGIITLLSRGTLTNARQLFGVTFMYYTA